MKHMETEFKKHILNGILLFFCVSILCLLVYEAQIKPHVKDSIKSTVMSEHKPTGEVVMSAEASMLTEVFVCKVPKLRQIQIACKGKNISEKSLLLMTLTELDTGKTYYEKEFAVKDVISEKQKSKIKIKLKKSIKKSEDKVFALSLQLVNPQATTLTITGNYKPGIVRSFNGDQDNKTNIIYSMKYSRCNELLELYIILCIALLSFVELSYYLIIVKKNNIEQFYIPIAIFLGIIFHSVIAIHGVPDEPGHFDTAYKYSNKMLFVDETGYPGTIFKRQCDVELQDSLANGVETNSYYQISENIFDNTESEELVIVQYTDSSNLVPGIIYFPAALGISIGRLLSLSAVITLSLARLMNLLAFVLLTWGAIRIIPVGKNMLGLLGLLPIAMQQGASASYDPVINGVIFLFIAYCFYLAEKSQIKKRDWCYLAILVILVAMSKSGAYIPVLLLVFLIGNRQDINKKLVLNWKKVLSIIVVGMIGIIAMLKKYMPTIQSLFSDQVRLGEEGEVSLYTLGYIFDNPIDTIYMYWNTFTKVGDNHLRGILGGLLGWLDIKVSWIYLIVLLIGLLLLVNVEDERYKRNKKTNLLMSISILGSVMIIMLSMLLAWTPIGYSYIGGLQGRYYYALTPMFFLMTSNNMITVKSNQCSKIWMTMLLTEVMIVLQVIVAII